MTPQETRTQNKRSALPEVPFMGVIGVVHDGIRFAARPTSTFYGWGCLDRLLEPLEDAMSFFRRALERKVMPVPGEFFHVKPGKRRRRPSPYRQWMRFSFELPMHNFEMRLDRLERMVRES